MKPLVISFSMGETSAKMAIELYKKYNGKRDIVTLLANTGKEKEESLEFGARVDEEYKLKVVWVEGQAYHGERKSTGHKIVSFDTASRNGEPFEDSIKKYGIPNVDFPQCTRELKLNPIKSYLKSIGLDDYETAVGIRIDEPKRLKPKNGIIYPMAGEFPTSKRMVNEFWAGKNYRLNIKGYEGNCDLCWKKSKRKLLTLLVEKPELADWWNEMEIKYGNHIPEGQEKSRKPPITFFRNNESILDLLEDSKEPFVKATDDKVLSQLMFSSPELDFTNGCEESCEAF